jgi:hypothetical protein
MKINLIFYVCVCLSLLTAFISTSSNSTQHTHFDAHIHGVSELTLVIEKQQLELEMRSPAQNIVGFEHHAKTDKERAAVTKAKQRLMQHHNLFSISDNHCVFINHDINISNMINHQHHEHSIEHDEDENITHQNIIARYSYHCKKASLPLVITVKVFDLFVGIDQIHAKWITESKQGSSTLNHNNQTIEIK